MSEHDWLADDADLSDGGALEDLLDGTDSDGGAETFLSLGPLVAAARRPPSGAELAGEAEATAVFRRLRTRPAAPSRARRQRRRGLRLIAIAGAVTVASATSAAAATGGLPGLVQDTAATLLGTVGISVPDGGGVPAGPPLSVPVTTTATAPGETATAVVADTTVEAEATPPITDEVPVAATTVVREAPASPPAEPGPSDDGDDAKPGKGGSDQTDDATPTPHDSSGKAAGRKADHTPPGQAGNDHEPGAGATKAKPPKASKATAGPAAGP